MIRVLLAEDHTIVRKGLRSLLEGEAGIDVIGEAENGREAIEKVQTLHPDIVLMDISMPVLNGLEATRRITQLFPKVRVLILTMHADEEYVFEILRAGASGYLLKQCAPSELITAIQAVFKDKDNAILSPSISKTVITGYIHQAEVKPESDYYDLLTNREREILQLLAEGHTTREVAECLCISIKTVETHRAHIMEKLDLHNTAELMKYALRKGIVME